MHTVAKATHIYHELVVGRKRPSFAVLFCFSVLRIIAVMHRCNVSCYTPSVATNRHAREVQRRVAANRHTQHAVKSCVPRRAVSCRLPMPPPCRVYP